LIYIEGIGKCPKSGVNAGAGGQGDGEVAKREREARRFYVQCRDGIWVAQERGYTVRTFVLTESDYAIGMELDWAGALRKFYKKMHYDYGHDIGLCWVEHLQGEKVRRNRHIVEWGAEKLDLDDLNDFWLRVYGSLVSWRKKKYGGMVVGSAEKCAKYLAEYFTGEGFIRAHFSHGWVFNGWFEFCKWCKVAYGGFPSISELGELAGLSAIERLRLPHYRAWYETVEARVRVRLADRMLGRSAVEAGWLADYKRRSGKGRPLRVV